MSRDQQRMERTGIEPVTSGLQSRVDGTTTGDAGLQRATKPAWALEARRISPWSQAETENERRRAMWRGAYAWLAETSSG